MGLFNLGKGSSDDGADNKDDGKRDDGLKPGEGDDDKGKDKDKDKDKNKDKPKDDKDDGADGKKKSDDADDISAMIQRAVAEATKGLKADNKSLQTQITELMKKGMTPEQIKEMEDKAKEDAQNQREADITERENRFYALTAIKEAGLDDGGKTALKLIDLVMGKDQEEIDAKVKTLSDLVKRMVKSEVAKTFKDNGRSPDGSDDGKDDKKDLAAKLGKRTAEANKKARSVLDIYTGGGK